MDKNKYFYKHLRIGIIGLGGGGNSIIKEIRSYLPNYPFVNFLAANVDRQALDSMGRGIKKFLFGEDVTHGLGCGMDKALGRKSAESARKRIVKEIEKNDLVILISSLGGGTGSGASPVFAKIARQKNKLVLGIFTLPFSFEKGKRSSIAQESLEELKSICNAVFVIPNDNIFKVADSNMPLRKSFSSINSILAQTLDHFINTMYKPGTINVDFADFNTTLEGRNRLFYLNNAKASGPNRAQEALRKVLYNPLSKYNFFLSDKKSNSNQKVDRILFNIEGGVDLKMNEVEEISKGITGIYPRAKIFFGVSRSNKKEKDIDISLFAVSHPPTFPTKSKTIIGKKPKSIKKGKNKKQRKNRKVNRKRGGKKNLKEKEVKSKPITEVNKKTNLSSPKMIRRSAIDVKNEEKKMEKELLEEEERLDIPAFLRQKQNNKGKKSGKGIN